jgi:hypothetical protein
MTDPRRRRTVAISVLAPISAALLSAATAWAIEHDPTEAANGAPASSAGSSDHKLSDLRGRVRHATHEYNVARRTLANVERQIRVRADAIRVVRAANARQLSARPAGRSTYAPSSVPAPIAPSPAPPPTTQSTTGAS